MAFATFFSSGTLTSKNCIFLNVFLPSSDSRLDEWIIKDKSGVSQFPEPTAPFLYLSGKLSVKTFIETHLDGCSSGQK